MWKGRCLRGETHLKIVKQSNSDLCPGPWRNIGTHIHVCNLLEPPNVKKKKNLLEPRLAVS